jgi:hypothetical protein
MLEIGSSTHKTCDGVSRRNFLKVGATGIGGLTLADVLRAESLPTDGSGSDSGSGKGSSHKAVINIHLAGGPPHQDMWDLKPDAPTEYRGAFSPIKTNAPGVQICELFPNLAKQADKFSLVRGLVGSVNEHSSSTAMTGYSKKSLQAAGGRPSAGSVISRLNHSARNQAPPFVSLMGKVTPGYLGPLYQPYTPDGAGRSNLQLDRIKADRLQDRRSLLAKMDRMRRDLDTTGKMAAMDEFTRGAVDMVLSGKMAKALDYQKETKEVQKRYLGHGQREFATNRNFLLARRMVEAGVRCVALSVGGWDTHNDNFGKLGKLLPAMDAGLSALIQDLDERSMLDDVSVVVWGEFGRTPKVNSKAGRDHWPGVSAAFMAGGGIKGGRVVGESDRYGGEAATPVHVQQVHSTLYHNMGIDVQTQQFLDKAGRPQYLLDNRNVIEELV